MSTEPKVTSRDRKNLISIALFIAGLFALLIIQFFNIQILEGDKWSRVAERQHFIVVNEPFHRGTFFSNTNIKKGHPEKRQPLVVDIEKFHLHADPSSIPSDKKREIVDHLLASLDLSVSGRLNLAKQFARKSRNRRLAMWLDHETRDKLIGWWQTYSRKNKISSNALFFVSDYQRSYPFGKLLGQVLHTVQNDKNEFNQSIPTGGLELWFDNFLKGKQGKRRLMRSPRNSFETGEIIAKPENGADIYLTINHCLQAIVEEEVAKGVENAKAKGGWAVMMDPHTGDILALAQYPFFYPPDYQSYFNDPVLIEHTRVKAISDANEPGSIMKPFTVAVGMKANEALKARKQKEIFNPLEKVSTSNQSFPGRTKPLREVSRIHNYLNMYMAMQKSSNIYMARLVQKVVDKLGNNFYRESLQEFGFGEKTNIELPGETKGVLPTPGKKHPNGALEWSIATPFSMCMGHNIQTNSIQMVRAFATLANGGRLVQPTLIKKIIKIRTDGTEDILVDHTNSERTNQFPQVLSVEHAKEIVKALKYVTKSGGARRADVWGYTEAGKSGSPNKIVNGTYSETLFCSSFIGFTPVENPAFVLIVTLNEPEYGYIPGVGRKHLGGFCAAPIFREIALRSLEYLGIPPDDPYGYPLGDPRYNPDKADWILENRLLKEMYEKWNNKKE